MRSKWLDSPLVRRWPDFASGLIMLAMVACIAGEELRLRAATYGPYADYWEHAAVLHALIADPWHPLNPHLVSSAPSPRFGPLAVLSALAARAFHLDALGALSLSAVIYTALFVVGIWYFFSTYFRDPRAGLYGLLVMLGAWWEAWTFTSIYQPKVLLSVASYPWLAAFGLTLHGLGLATRELRGQKPNWWRLAVLVLWMAVVLLTHQITAMMALTALLLLAATEPSVPLRHRVLVAGTAVAGCVLAAAWPYFSVWNLMAGGREDAGWVGRGLHAAVTGIVRSHRHRFYDLRELSAALGLGLLAVVFLPYFFLKWRRLFVGAGVLSMLGPFVINAFVPLPLGHRFILLAVFFLHVGVVWLCLAITPGSKEFLAPLDRRWLRTGCLIVVWGALLVFGYHNVQRTRREWDYFASYARRGESPIVRYARATGEIAGSSAVVLGDTVSSWPIPAFGPKVVALQHANPFVPDESERDESVDRFFDPTTSDEQREAIIRRFQVTHVITTGQARGAVARFLSTRAHADRLPARHVLYTLSLPIL